MSKGSLCFIIITLLMLVVTPALADELLSIKAGYQMLEPDGSIAGNDNVIGVKLDTDDDLDWDDSEDLLAELALQWGNSRLSFSYMPIEFSGTNPVTVEGTYNGQSFSIGDTVASDVKLDLYDIGYTYYLLNMDDVPTRFQLGVEFAIKVADIEIAFDSNDAGIQESESVVAPLPTVGLRTRIALADLLGISARAGYLEYDGNNFLDADVQLEFSPLPLAGIFVGYRFFDLEVDESDIYVDLEFSGPYAGVMVRF